MSVLRRAKLRTPDGTESIEYPLGVEAKNVEVANGENLSQRLARIDEDLEKNEEDIAAVSELAGTNKQNIGANEIRIDALERRSASVDKKPYYFNTVADMKAYQGLKEGDMTITLGYYEANDGGNAEYLITSEIDNNNYQETIANNLYATLILKNVLKPEMFGAIGNSENDDTNFINICIAQAKRTNLPIFFSKFYAISSSIKFDFALKIDGIYNLSGLIQTNSDEDILYFDRPYKVDVKGIQIKNIVLAYKTFGNKNTTAMRFKQSSTIIDGWGFHESEFLNLIIRNAYTGILNEQSEPSWNVHLNNIRLNSIGFCAVNISANFGFDMDFIVLGDNISEFERDFCLRLNCTGVLRNLDVEDWSTTVLYCNDAYDTLQIEQIHLERCSLNKNYIGFLRLENQYVKIGAITLFNCQFKENINDRAYIIAYNFIGTSRLIVEDLSLINCTKINAPSVIYGIYISRITGSNNVQCVSLFGAQGGGLISESNMIGGIVTSNVYYNLKPLA